MDLVHKFKGYDETNSEMSIKHLLGAASGKVWLTPLKDLNDPHERYFESKCPGWEKNIGDIKVGSLANGSNSNYLMWIHYANSFCGISVEYNKSKIRNEVKKLTNTGNEIYFNDVEYVYKMEEITCCEDINFDKKFFQWHYEQESRIIAKNVDFNFIEVKPEKIMIGKCLPPVISQKVKKLCSDKGIEVGTAHPNMANCFQKKYLDIYFEFFSKLKNVSEK